MLNAITVDVEDWFHVAIFRKVIDRKDWDRQEVRIHANICRVLKLFEEFKVKGTFFVLGWIAERYPEVVLTIKKYGHEIGSHGYSHAIIYEHSKEDFVRDLERSISVLEKTIDEQIYSYRAPSYSITLQTLWALEMLSQKGIRYDSSIFPIKHDLYGIPAMPRFPFYIKCHNGQKLIEFPLSTVQIWKENVPISGGGYLRLFPFWFIKNGIKRLNDIGKPVILYFHPWELDPAQPRLHVNFVSRFRHYFNLEATESRLRRLLSEFEFSSLGEVMESLKIEYQWPSLAEFQRVSNQVTPERDR
ncbi:MAG: XrtA system polysaccharide deacetylase [bacterium]